MMQYKAVFELFQKLHLQIYANQFMTYKFFHFHLSFFIWKMWKGREKLRKCEYLENKKSFLDKIKNTFHAGLRQTWKTWKKQSFLWHSGKTWKTQGILEKYFKFLENSGDSMEIDFLIKLLHFLATIYFKWHYSLFTLYTTVIAGSSIYIFIWFEWLAVVWNTLAVYSEMP